MTSVEVRSATYAYCLLSYATPHRRGVRFWVGGERSRPLIVNNYAQGRSAVSDKEKSQDSGERGGSADGALGATGRLKHVNNQARHLKAKRIQLQRERGWTHAAGCGYILRAIFNIGEIRTGNGPVALMTKPPGCL